MRTEGETQQTCIPPDDSVQPEDINIDPPATRKHQGRSKLQNTRDSVPGLASRMIEQGYKAKEPAPPHRCNGKSNLIALLLILSYLLVGVFFFHWIEDWSIVDSIYFATTIVTTVGYGDVTPTTETGRAFTIVYAFYGIVTVGIALGRVADWFVKRQQEIAKNARKKLLNRVDSAAASTGIGKSIRVKMPKALGRKRSRLMKMKKSSGLYRIMHSTTIRAIVSGLIPLLLSIIAGMALGAVEGWSFLDCMYYTIITITTVGFGDVSPTSLQGRICAIFYLPFSVIAVAHSIGSVIEELSKRSAFRMKISMKELLAMDVDGDGKVSKMEYLCYMLIKLDKIEREDVDMIMNQFDHLDKDKSGELDHADLVRIDDELQQAQHEDDDDDEDEPISTAEVAPSSDRTN